MSIQRDRTELLDEGAEQPAVAGRRRRRRWMLVACVVLVACLAVSLLGASLWRSSVRAQEAQTFDLGASDVATTLETLLRRDSDFVGSLRAMMTMQPGMSDGRFEAWFAELQGKVRLAGGLGTTVVERVPASRLASFQVRRDADSAFRAVVDQHVLRVAPSGRASYCLLADSVWLRGGLGPVVEQVLQGDWCAPNSLVGRSQGMLLRAQTDTAQLLVQPVTAGGVRTIIFQTAFYRRGASLASVAQRRAAVNGWLLSSFDIPALMQSAIGVRRGLSLALYHTNPGHSSELISQAGAGGAKRFSYHRMLQIGGSWSVVVSGAPAARGLSANVEALLVLAVGVLIAALLFALILVLTRSRERALEMVRERTGELRYQALHDTLTGLPNRALALDRAKQMLARARRQHSSVAALYVDIDGFKRVNDSFGHPAGDRLLQIVAERLMTVVRDADTAARMSGDEFVVLLEGATRQEGPELVAERVLEVLSAPCDLQTESGHRLSVTASVGVAVGGRLTADELLYDADLALYEAKAAGRNRYAMFESHMQVASQARIRLEMDLADALEHRQLLLLFQPLVDLRSETVIGVETLIRWRHPERGVIVPDGFIPLAEQSGLIVPIGRWVLREACRQAATWHRHGHYIGISVNVSARQLEDDRLIEDVRDALRDSGLDAAALTLEVTETALMRDCEETAARLGALKELGVRIAIDDFGTGYSSLAYLSRFPADTLKIDRSFVEGIATSSSAAALIHTFVQLAKALDLETLAEGIEDRAQLEALQREGCDQGQGFIFSRPLIATDMERFLDDVPVSAPGLAIA